MMTFEKWETFAAQDILQSIKSAFVYAAFTDRLLLSEWPEETIAADFSKLLELRIFNESMEVRLFRDNIGVPFTMRIADDSTRVCEYYDQDQYLDIDDKRSDMKSNTVYSTGGGKYHLPISKAEAAKVRIRFYVGYYERSGQAYISDVRLVNLVEGA